ncbi:MAG: hypothetical protein ABI594_09565 [Ginsengibacter sp.]
MKRQEILFLIPFAIIAGLLIFGLSIILFTDVTATWQYYLALVLFIVIIVIYFKSFKKVVIAMGIYLLLATFNALSLTPFIYTYWFRIGPIETPQFSLLALVLLVIFLVLNSDILIDMYLDRKEKKTQRK